MKKKRDYYSEFIDETVNAVIDFDMSETQAEEGVSISNNQPLVFTGVLLDYDDDNVYLGNKDGQINQIIPRDKLLALQRDPDEVPSADVTDKNLN